MTIRVVDDSATISPDVYEFIKPTLLNLHSKKWSERKMAANLPPISGSRYIDFSELQLDGVYGNPPDPLYTLVDEEGNTLFECHENKLMRTIIENSDTDALTHYLMKYPQRLAKVHVSYRDAFHQAISLDSIVSLRILLEYYATHATTIESPNDRGFLMLNVACKDCHVEMARFLLDEYPEYADIHARSRNDISAILAAAKCPDWDTYSDTSCREETIRMLLDKGSSTQDFSQWASQPGTNFHLKQPLDNVLTLAVPWAGPGLIKQLIDKGADPNEKTCTYSTGDRIVMYKFPIVLDVSALFVASIYWNIDVIRVLLEYRGKDIDISEAVSYTDSYGRLPLHWAAGGSKWGFHPDLSENPNFMRRAVETLKLLVESNPSSINAQDQDGETPLHYAAHSYGRLTSMYKGVFQYLLDNGADASIRNKDGKTPFQFLCDRYDDGVPLDVTTMDLLYTDSEDLALVDSKGNTCLHKMASQWDRIEAVKFLLDRGASVTATNGQGNTPLHEATSDHFTRGHVEPEQRKIEIDNMVKILLEAGGDCVAYKINAQGRMAIQTSEGGATRRIIGGGNDFSFSNEDPHTRGFGYWNRGRSRRRGRG
jgi:ankyrin repeat protein